MNKVAHHLYRIGVKILRIVLYYIAVTKINENWTTISKNCFHRWICEFLIIIVGIATLECVINILYHLFNINSDRAGDLFIFCVIMVPLFLLANCNGGDRMSLTTGEKVMIRETLREVDRYKANDNVHNYYKKNGRL